MIPSLKVGTKLLSFEKAQIMGILNITSDSFYTKGKHNSKEGALLLAAQMLEEGASVLDIGGQSSRPGAQLLAAEEERKKVVPIIELIIKSFPEAIISVDTFHASVAKAAVEAGALIVNDISAGKMDDKMLQTISDLKVSYIMMHMQGTPQTMQQDPKYKNVNIEVFDFLNERIQAAQDLGIYNIMIDPGFGFGKTLEQNYHLLKNLNGLQVLEKAILVGISRKSMIQKVINKGAEEALNGTTALHMLALNNGANMLRVHDVKAAKEAIDIFSMYQKN